MFEFLSAVHWGVVAQIIAIDILLGGDNAIVIALACRNLEKKQRIQGIVWGTVAAIAMRVVLIFFAMSLLKTPYLKLIGGALLVWIGIKLIVPQEEHSDVQAASSVWGAVRTIFVADLVMSFDNVIGIAGAADSTPAGHAEYYVIFGLLVSVPIIIWGSSLVLKLIDRFPWVVILGGALLGWIAGGMFVTDTALFDPELGEAPSRMLSYTAHVVSALFVIAVGFFITHRKKFAQNESL